MSEYLGTSQAANTPATPGGGLTFNLYQDSADNMWRWKDASGAVHLVAGAQPFLVQAYSSTLTLPGNDNYTYRVALTGNLVLAVPSSNADGARLRFWLNASDGSYTLSLAAGIVVPASSSFASPVTIAAGHKARVTLEYDAVQNGGQWELVSFVNGY